MKKVTLKDIARELDVTVGTVSHVLNGIDDISEKTKKRVLDKAREMGYISNNSAVALRSGKTGTIAIIIPDISNPHISYQIKQIEDKMRKAGYSVIILNTNENENTEYEAIRTACGKGVDGILLCPTQQSRKNVEFLNKIEIPYILIGRYFAEIDTDYVCADDFKGGYIAAKYLCERGFSKPVYIGAFDYIEASRNRFDGICKAFSEYDNSVSDSSFLQTSPNEVDCAKIVKEIAETEFDSIIAFSDLIAFEIMSELKRNKWDKIPIVSFDAINSHLYLPFFNVSVGMTGGGWAEQASSALIDKLNGRGAVCKKLIDVEIFEFNK